MQHTNCDKTHHQYEYCSQAEIQSAIFGNNSKPCHAAQVTEIKTGDICYPDNRKNTTWEDKGKLRKKVLHLMKFSQITVSEECCLFNQVD